MDRGYVKLWRRAFDSGMHRNHKLWAAWTYILAHAAYKETTVYIGNQTVRLKRGQLIVGRKRLAEELGISEQNCRTILDSLEKAGNLTSKTTNRFTVLTVENYELYQGEGATVTSKTTSNQPTTNQQLTTSKEGKKERINTFSSDSDEIRLSRLLFDLIRERNPEHKTPNLQAWARHIDLTLRIDKRTPEQLERVIRWSQADSFWQNVILSTAKLREKFDQLWPKANGNGQGGTVRTSAYVQPQVSEAEARLRGWM